MANTIRLRRGLEADRTTITPAEGEMIYTTDTNSLYIGDGSTAGGVKFDFNLDDIDVDTITANQLDINGTVTADGLTVDGDVEISSPSPEIYLMESDTTDVNTRIRTSVGDFRIETINDAKNSIVLRQLIDHATGDISFYEDTGATPKFFWDASAERLGIGTTSPNHDLDIEITDTDTYSASASSQPDMSLRIVNEDTTTANTTALMGFASKGTTSTQSLWYIGNVGMDNAYADSSFIFGHRTGGSGWNEVVRFDGSGNVGIGTSSPNAALHVKGTTTAVTSITETTSTYAVNKLKNGTKEFDVALDGNGLYFYDQTNNTERMRIDSSGNLDMTAAGSGNIKMKSGNGIYLGGTGAANKLDDYEEGTFVPVLSDAATGGNNAIVTVRVGHYTKIGSSVTVYMTFVNINTSGMNTANTGYIQGLPFTSKSTAYQIVPANVTGNLINNLKVPTIGSNTTAMYSGISPLSDITSTGADLYVTLTYEV